MSAHLLSSLGIRLHKLPSCSALTKQSLKVLVLEQPSSSGAGCHGYSLLLVLDGGLIIKLIN